MRYHHVLHILQRRQQRHRRLALLLADQLPQRHRGGRAFGQFQTQLHHRAPQPDHHSRSRRHAQAAAPAPAASPADPPASPAFRRRAATRPVPRDQSRRPGPSGGCRRAAPRSAPAARLGASTPSAQANAAPTRAGAARSAPSPGSRRGGQCVVSSFDEISHDALMAPTRAAGVRSADAQAAAGVAAGRGVRGRDRVRDRSGHPAGVADLTAARQHRPARRSMRRGQGGGRRLGVLVRYADDLVVLCATREQAEQARELVAAVLDGLGLRLHPEKTRIAHLARGAEGFDFLGFHHRMRESWKQRVAGICTSGRPGGRWPRSEARFATARTAATRGCRWNGRVENLNPVLRGWGNYFRYGNSARQVRRKSTATSANASRCSPAPSTDCKAATGSPASTTSGRPASASIASTERCDPRLRMPAGERCRRAVCGRTARTVRCGGGRQPRASRANAPRGPQMPPADPTMEQRRRASTSRL